MNKKNSLGKGKEGEKYKEVTAEISLGENLQRLLFAILNYDQDSMESP